LKSEPFASRVPRLATIKKYEEEEKMFLEDTFDIGMEFDLGDAVVRINRTFVDFLQKRGWVVEEVRYITTFNQPEDYQTLLLRHTSGVSHLTRRWTENGFVIERGELWAGPIPNDDKIKIVLWEWPTEPIWVDIWDEKQAVLGKPLPFPPFWWKSKSCDSFIPWPDPAR
jgi:hypothetical protein